MKHYLLTIAALLTFVNAAAAETYVLDPGHTEVRFYWNHAGLTRQSGEFTRVSGTIDFDASDVAATKAVIEIDPGSIHSGVEALDADLTSDAFFDVDAHPIITFISTNAVQTGANTMRLSGDLVIKSVSFPVDLDVTLKFQGTHPLGGFFEYYEGESAGVEATSTLLRTDHGVGLYAPGTSDAVELEISAEMRAGGWPE